MNTTIYQNIATRTAGDIYIGVVGPVRTGKSTFIKKFMENLVIPNMRMLVYCIIGCVCIVSMTSRTIREGLVVLVLYCMVKRFVKVLLVCIMLCVVAWVSL